MKYYPSNYLTFCWQCFIKDMCTCASYKEFLIYFLLFIPVLFAKDFVLQLFTSVRVINVIQNRRNYLGVQGLHLHSQCLADTWTLFQIESAILILFANCPHPRSSAGTFNSLFYYSACLITPSKIQHLVRDIKPPNHQSCFPQFFPRIFLSFSSWKRKQTF